MLPCFNTKKKKKKLNVRFFIKIIIICNYFVFRKSLEWEDFQHCVSSSSVSSSTGMLGTCPARIVPNLNLYGLWGRKRLHGTGNQFAYHVCDSTAEEILCSGLWKCQDKTVQGDSHSVFSDEDCLYFSPRPHGVLPCFWANNGVLRGSSHLSQPHLSLWCFRWTHLFHWSFW